MQNNNSWTQMDWLILLKSSSSSRKSCQFEDHVYPILAKDKDSKLFLNLKLLGKSNDIKLEVQFEDRVHPI